mmetsp:Transcript_630/g.1659  ORF Transcript_630/g.1659 Transcript_630/m.1659 type:complete len:239 (+) Transcript_630:3025-3741(+)
MTKLCGPPNPPKSSSSFQCGAESDLIGAEQPYSRFAQFQCKRRSSSASSVLGSISEGTSSSDEYESKDPSSIVTSSDRSTLTPPSSPTRRLIRTDTRSPRAIFLLTFSAVSASQLSLARSTRVPKLTISCSSTGSFSQYAAARSMSSFITVCAMESSSSSTALGPCLCPVEDPPSFRPSYIGSDFVFRSCSLRPSCSHKSADGSARSPFLPSTALPVMMLAPRSQAAPIFSLPSTSPV